MPPWMPGFDFLVDNCFACKKKTRVFEIWRDRMICLDCYRGLVERALRKTEKEG